MAATNSQEIEAVTPTTTEVSEKISELEEPIDASTETETEADRQTEADKKAEAQRISEAYENSLRAFDEGEIVEGTVVGVSGDEVTVDIGFKSEGSISASEFSRDEKGKPNVKIGEKVKVYIVKSENADGQIVLSKKRAEQQLVWTELDELYRDGEIVEVHTTERIKGGLKVKIKSLFGFLPASQVSLQFDNLDNYIGKDLRVKIVKLNRRRQNIVVSHRAVLEEELASKKEAILSSINKGDEVSGVVKNITQFGVFVDLGGVDGLLHKSDLSWRKIHSPNEIVSVGDEIRVKILGFDRENEQISLGLKQLVEDPWKTAVDKYPIGATVNGKIVNIVSYGAFVELEDGVEGLVHVSEMSWMKRNTAPSRLVSKGQTIEARVLEVDTEKRRISLGMKQLVENPWELLETKYPFGTRITGKVKSITKFGAFVELEENIDGLVHSSDFSWFKRHVNPHSQVKVGDEVTAMVQKIDPAEQRISLSIKHVAPNPWDAVVEKYKVGTTVNGKIVGLTNFGAFVKLEEGVEGLLHISELSDKRIERPSEVISKGQELDLKVIELKPEEHRIGLSLRRLHHEQGRSQVEAMEERYANVPQQKPKKERRKRRDTRSDDAPIDSFDESTGETMFGETLKAALEKKS